MNKKIDVPKKDITHLSIYIFYILVFEFKTTQQTNYQAPEIKKNFRGFSYIRFIIGTKNDKEKTKS